MTEKQRILKSYLIDRLGYDLSSENDYEFLRIVANNSFNYSAIRNTAQKPEILKLRYYSFDKENNLYKPNRYGLFDYLFDEIDIKSKKKSFTKNEKKSQYTTASEYSSHVFCQISGVLNRRFAIPPTVVQDKGTQMHEKTLLINKFINIEGETLSSKQSFGISPDSYMTEQNKDFFTDIDSSKLVYSGHTNDKSRFFFGKKSNFVGQPDYIFKNEIGESFIVEEKFRLLSNGQSRVSIFRSHRIQILSYIYMIDELNIDYGYILYWISKEKYGGYGSYVELDECVVFRIDRTKKNRYLLGEVYKDYQAVKFSNKEIDFEPDLINPNKCGTCSASMFCTHKLGHNQTIYYDTKYEDLFKVYPVPYPEELKKSNEEKAQEIEAAKEYHRTNEVPPIA